MLVQCEPIVSDTGPTLYQHWVNVWAVSYYCRQEVLCRTSGSSLAVGGGGYGVKGSDPALNQCSHREYVFVGFIC